MRTAVMQRFLALTVVASLAVALTCRTAHADPPDESAMRGPVADIDPFFTFPYLVLPGRASPMNSGQWEVGLTVTGFFYL